MSTSLRSRALPSIVHPEHCRLYRPRGRLFLRPPEPRVPRRRPGRTVRRGGWL